LITVHGAGHELIQSGSQPIDPDIETVNGAISSFFFSKLAPPG
jgi:hypothetical protein